MKGRLAALLVLAACGAHSRSHKVIKLAPDGTTRWARPSTFGSEIRAGAGEILVRRHDTSSNTAWVYDDDGYLLGANGFYGIDPFNDSDPAYFVRRMFKSANGMRVCVGSANGMTNVGGGVAKTFSGTSMQVIRETANAIYIGVGNGAGGFDIEVMDHAGVLGPPIASAASCPGTFDVLPTGDVATACGTASAVTLRRIGASTFTRTLPLSAYSTAPHVAVAPMSNNRVFWIHSAQSPIQGAIAGYTAEVLDATGNLTWSVTRADPTYNSGGEVLDIAASGTDVALVGSYQCGDPLSGGSSKASVPYGEGFVQLVRP